MGISFADIVDKSKEIKVEFGGGNSLNMTYDPSALSPAKISKMNKDLRKAEQDADAEDDERLLSVANMFCGIVKTWDLMGPIGEDDSGEPLIPAGQPVPVEAEYVAWLPAPVISHVMDAITDDASPKGKKRR